MKKVVGTILIALGLVSCQGYHHVSTVPVVPEFSGAGQVDGQVSMNNGAFQYQGSISITKNIGVYHNGFRRGPSSIDGAGLLGFARFGKEKQFAVFGKAGYEKGYLYGHTNQASNQNRYSNYASTFERYNGMIGFQFQNAFQPSMHFGFYLGFQRVQFYRLSEHEYSNEKPTDKLMWGITNTQTEHIQIINPALSFTYYFPDGPLYFRMVIFFDELNKSFVDGQVATQHFNHLNQTYYTTYSPSRLKIHAPQMYITAALGVHLDVPSWFKKK